MLNPASGPTPRTAVAVIGGLQGDLRIRSPSGISSRRSPGSRIMFERPIPRTAQPRLPMEATLEAQHAPAHPLSHRRRTSRTRVASPFSESTSLLTPTQETADDIRTSCSSSTPQARDCSTRVLGRPWRSSAAVAGRRRGSQHDQRSGMRSAASAVVRQLGEPTIELVANHSSRVEPADACFRDCIGAASQLLTVGWRRRHLALCYGTNRERPRLLQRRAGVGRMHYRIRAKESPAAAAAAVALRQRRSAGRSTRAIVARSAAHAWTSPGSSAR